MVGGLGFEGVVGRPVGVRVPPSAPSLGRGHSSPASRKRIRNVPGGGLTPGSLFSDFLPDWLIYGSRMF